ncbi:MAG: DUF523 and DUF1722 domain-containing protein [Deltaproteobacteria bacterium]|nr:DUF523 and DUF1722 domain-containing protein [Deltaproteobacteria bacterium]
MAHPVIRLGISSCLLGEQVRWDGGHKLDPGLADQLGRFARYYPVCPEVGCGFSVPREPLCLVGDPHAPRLVTVRTRQDHTGRMLGWARRRVRELGGEELCGFIFKGKSPSCGTERVKVYNARGVVAPKGVGIFARVFREHFPLLPVEDDGRLQEPQLRANFIERCLVMKQWRDGLRQRRRSHGKLLQFHTEQALLILSHSPRHHRIIGELVARARTRSTADLYAEYQSLLLEALRLKATPAKHGNVLQHIMGYFKKQLTPDAKQELLEIIASYRQRHVPLIVPITLINNYVRLYDQPYLKGQRYLHPHPLELQLRNYI